MLVQGENAEFFSAFIDSKCSWHDNKKVITVILFLQLKCAMSVIITVYESFNVFNISQL